MFWFEASADDVHSQIWATSDQIIDEQQPMRDAWRRWTQKYLDTQVSGFKPGEWRPGMDVMGSVDLITNDARPSSNPWNMIRAAADTLISSLVLDEPAIKFQTQAGPEQLQFKADLLEQFIAGNFDRWNFARTESRAIRNAVICGTGYIEVLNTDDSVRYRPVHPDRVVVDESIGLDTDATVMFRVDFVTRHALSNQFPRKREDIEATKRAISSGAHEAVGARDLIEVREAWHLSERGRPGRHTITIDNATLMDDRKFMDDKFPIVPLRFNDNVQGWHGTTPMAQAEVPQDEINFMMDKIHGNMVYLSEAFIYKDKSSQIKDVDVRTNERYKIIEGVTPPQVIHPQPVHPQIVQYLEMNVEKVFEAFGVGRFDATQANPALPRLDSAAALRLVQNVQTKRHAEFVRNRDRALKEVVLITMREGRKIGSGFKAKGLSRRLHRMIDWSEVDMEDNQFHLSVSTVNILSRNPAGRRADVQELVQSTLLRPDQALQLLDQPDFEKFYALENVARDNLEDTFESMLKDGVYRPPFEFQALELGYSVLGPQYYLWAQKREFDEDKLGLIATWIHEAQAMDNRRKAAQQAAQAPPQLAVPQGAAGPAVPPQPAIQDFTGATSAPPVAPA